MPRSLSLILLFLLFSFPAAAQTAASATWALTANQTASVTGAVTAADQQLSGMQVSYSSSVQRSSPTPTAGTWSAETGENSGRYMQFSITANSSTVLTVTSLSMKLYVNSGSNMRATVYYSKDAAFTSRTQIGSTFSLTTTVPSSPNVSATPSVTVNAGESIYLRIYPWNTGATTGKYVITNSVVISGTSISTTAILPSVTSLSQFTQPTSSPSSVSSYTVTGTGLSSSVTITPPANFEVSADGGSTWHASASPVSMAVSGGTITGEPVTILVRANAASAGLSTGVITHTSSGASDAEVAVSAVRLSDEPSASSSIGVSGVTGSQMTLTFSGGNGANRLAVVRAGSAVSWVPTDGEPVSGANADVTSAADLGSGQKIVFNGTGNSVTVTGLSGGITYYASVFEYNVATGNSQNYRSSAGTASATTTAVPFLNTSAASLSFGLVETGTSSSVQQYTLSANFLSPSSGTVTVTAPTGYSVSLSAGSGYGTSVPVPYTGGTLSGSTIYVKFQPTSLGSYNGTITHSGGSASTVSVSVSGTGASASVLSNTPTGYASLNGGTTGGAGGSTTTVSTLADLLTFAANCENNTTPKILVISGKISSATTTTAVIKHGANITVLGASPYGELENVGIRFWDYNNVILRNMKIHEVFYPDDAVTVDACSNVWIDHNELYSKIGAGITVDTYDGLLDIKNGSKYVTASWNYLHHHMKCSLIGHSDNTGQQATDSQIRVTYHHNRFSHTDGRNPSLRYGAIHMYNNLFEEVTDYGLAARDGAHAKVENCVYNNVNLSMSTDKFPVSGLPNGYICQSGNLIQGTTGSPVISQTGCDFWDATNLPYSYTLDAVEDVEASVTLLAGLQSALPVQLSSFTGKAVPGGVLLTWKTATEENNAGFEVQKRVRGEWTVATFVAGAGTTNQPHAYQYVDRTNGGAVSYRLRQVDHDGAFTYSAVVDVQSVSPAEYGLSQNFPNPFNPSTTMRFTLGTTDRATVTVFDALGRRVTTLFDGAADAGRPYDVTFHAEQFPSGVYFAVLRSGERTEMKRMLYLK